MYSKFKHRSFQKTRGISRGENRFTSGNKQSFSTNNYNKPSYQGSFGRPRRGPRPLSQLGGDINLFIKKAAQTSSEEVFTPTHSFTTLPIVGMLMDNILNHGYKTPTPIQDGAILPILEGRDLIGLASTGTGKTAAFLIPLIDKVFKNRNSKVLIIAPTRELAAQINQEFKSFAISLNLHSALVIGGSGLNRQISDVRRRPNFVIATPGRLRDLIERRVLNLSEFDTFVLDEVDLMVDIGFIHDIKYFVSLLPVRRQSLFFSATIDNKTQEILQNFVTDPITVSVKKQDTSENVDQNIIKIKSKEQKIDQLHDLLISEGFDKVLVFGRTKHGVEKLNKQLILRGFKVGAIHGNKNQNQRQRAIESFKRNEFKILLATDVASRGLDIENVSHVINYDLPETFDDYVHRIGRTGRAGQKGQALTFVD
jgi:ATP-dependent RNA helicase RhlE